MIGSSAPLPVAFFLPALSGGGAERVTLYLAGGFAARGVPVDLLLAVAEGPYLTQVPPGVRVIDLEARSVPAKVFALARYARRERPRALIAALDNVNVAGCAMRFARVPTPVTLAVHNTVSRDLGADDTVKGLLRRHLLRRLYPLADAIVAVSRGVADDLTRVVSLPPERVRVIYNPVLTPAAVEPAGPAPHVWLEPGAPPLILAVGRLTGQKDFATLLRAFASARAERPLHLAILGEGEERRPLEALAAELGIGSDVMFRGFEQNPYEWMAGAAALALSSRWEGLPTVLIEALALGTPVVSTDCESGPREILESGRFGALVPVGDAQALSTAILATIDSPPDSRMLRERGRTFSLDHAVDQYLALLSEQAGRRRGQPGQSAVAPRPSTARSA
jgi:glycosyltransferase involved in cell wall biosynthesis